MKLLISTSVAARKKMPYEKFAEANPEDNLVTLVSSKLVPVPDFVEGRRKLTYLGEADIITLTKKSLSVMQYMLKRGCTYNTNVGGFNCKLPGKLSANISVAVSVSAKCVELSVAFAAPSGRR